MTRVPEAGAHATFRLELGLDVAVHPVGAIEGTIAVTARCGDARRSLDVPVRGRLD